MNSLAKPFAVFGALPVFLVATVACGQHQGAPGFSDAEGPEAQVTSTYVANLGTESQKRKVETLTCPSAEKRGLCRLLISLSREKVGYFGDSEQPALRTPPAYPDTLVGGGEIRASISGTVQGEPVNAKFNDRFNVAGRGWSAVEPLFVKMGLIDDEEFGLEIPKIGDR